GRVTVFAGPPVLDEFDEQRTCDLRLNLVHELHRFDNAKHLVGLNTISDSHKRSRSRSWRIIISTNNRRFYNYVLFFFFTRRRRLSRLALWHLSEWTRRGSGKVRGRTNWNGKYRRHHHFFCV